MDARFYHIETWQMTPKEPKRLQIDFSDDWHIMTEFSHTDKPRDVARKLEYMAAMIMERELQNDQ